MRISGPFPTTKIQTAPSIDEVPHLLINKPKSRRQHTTCLFSSPAPSPPSLPPAESGKAATRLSLRSPPSKSGRNGGLDALHPWEQADVVQDSDATLWRLIHPRFVPWSKHLGSDSWPATDSVDTETLCFDPWMQIGWR